MGDHSKVLCGPGQIGVVAIGRNEGDRLKRCLASLADVEHRVYVDSASTDDSVAWARAHDVNAIELATPPKLSAARARNAGLARLVTLAPATQFVQMVDGDCEVQPGWLQAARAVLESDPAIGIVFGRRRERFPERSIYNALCDDEWNTPIGESLTCGGDILCRIAAFQAIGGYDEGMIAGEDPDMAIRLRAAGWRIRRIDQEMTLHDAAILSYGQWWRRSKRAGHAYAELAHRHAGTRQPDWRRQCRSIVIWGGVAPSIIVIAVIGAWVFSPWWLLAPAAVIGLRTLQIARLARQRPDLPPRIRIARGVFFTMGKAAEFLGLVRFHAFRLAGRQSRLIEYKGAAAPSVS